MNTTHKLNLLVAAAVAVALTTSLPAAMAQTTAAGTIGKQVGKIAAPSAVALQKRVLPKRTFTPIAVTSATMDGWTAVTDTATLGGASLMTMDGKSVIVTTGSDGALYAADFNASAPGLISDWSYQPGGLASEPHCAAVRMHDDTAPGYTLLCLGLTASGEARLVELTHAPSGFNYARQVNLGGNSGPAAPSFLGAVMDIPPTPYSSSSKRDYHVGVIVGTTVWQYFVLGTENSVWKPQIGAFKATPACLSMTCATPTLAQDAIRAMTFNYEADKDTSLKEDAVSPKAPTALSGETAIVSLGTNKPVAIVARGKDTQLYQIGYDPKTKTFLGSWKLQGGAIPPHTVPSCVAVGMTPVCVIQGADGRLYAKKLASAGAL